MCVSGNVWCGFDSRGYMFDFLKHVLPNNSVVYNKCELCFVIFFILLLTQRQHHSLRVPASHLLSKSIGSSFELNGPITVCAVQPSNC